jgi:arylsulfatase A-like enzyme
MIRNGYHQKISGDIMLVADPAYIEYSGKGTTHGSGYNYDTHVPLLFFGAGVKNGYSYEHTNITDVAPTISALLGISYPNASTGRVLEDALD